MLKKLKTIIVWVIVISFFTPLFFNIFTITGGSLEAEPGVTDNKDGTYTANWYFTNPSNYTLTNIELTNNQAQLKTIIKNLIDDTPIEFNKGKLENIIINGADALELDLSQNSGILIADSSNHRVMGVNNGNWLWQYGTNTSSGYGINELNNPSFAVFLPNNRFLITDTNNNRVLEVDSDGKFYWQFGSNTSSGKGNNLLDHPTSAIEMSNNNVLISDSLNDYVLEVNRSKEIVWQYNGLSEPRYAEELSNGSILITDTNNHRVIEVNKNKQIYWQYGTGKSGFQSNQLTTPYFATRLSTGNTLIADSGNERVIEVDSSKNIVWQYGKNRASGYSEDRLNHPTSSIRLSNSNTLISDFGNHRVLEVTPTKSWVKQYGVNNTSGSSDNCLYNPSSGLIFESEMVIGNIESSVFDGGGITNWTTISWSEEIPSKTKIGLYIRTGDTPNPSSGSWSAWSTEYQNPSSNIIKSPKNRYIQYKAILVTNDRLSTPVLKSVKITGERFTSTGELITTFFSPSKLLNWGSINIEQQLNGQSIKTYYSTSVDSPWLELGVDNDLSSASIESSKIRFKFVLSTTNTYLTPVLLDMSLTYACLGGLSLIKVSPATAEVYTGEDFEFTAQGFDEYGREISISPVWETDVGVMKDNILTAQDTPGIGIVSAHVGEFTSSAEVTVLLNPKIHHPPEIKPKVPAQVMPEDSAPWTLDLSKYEFDTEDPGTKLFWYLTDLDENLVTVTGAYSRDDILTFIPNQDAFGTCKATLWLVDSDEMTSSQLFWINITPVNDKPLIEEVPDISLHYDEEYTFDYYSYISDIDTPMEDLSLEVLEPSGHKFTTVSGFSVTYKYPKSMLGETIFINLMVSDGETQTKISFIVSITDNFAPVLVKSFSDLVLSEGELRENVFDLTKHFIDPNNDTLTYTCNGKFVSIVINKDLTVSISALNWSGTERINIRAMDPFGAMAEGFFKVVVLGVNDPPTIKGVPNFLVRYEYDYKFNLTRYINDQDNTTDELTIIPSDLEHIYNDLNDNMVIIMNYPSDYLGSSLDVSFTVFDGINFSSQEVTVSITDDYPPELVKPLPDIVFSEDESLLNAIDLNHHFEDQDDIDLEYTIRSKDISITHNENNTIDFFAPQDWFGTEYIQFRVTDPKGALQEDVIQVTVIPVNDPPLISALPAQFINESASQMLDLKPYISDVDTDFSELEIFVNSEYVVVSGSKIIIFGSQDLSEIIEITISDGEFNTTTTLPITLNRKATPDSPNLFSSFINLIPILLAILIISFVIFGIVHRKRNKFTVEEVFLIHKCGIMISHVSRTPQANVDDVIFSGMFTAVQEFIHDSFSKGKGTCISESEDKNWVLDELKLGDNKILIEWSENVYLAVIFSGRNSNKLRRIVKGLLDEIEDEFSDILKNWNGEMTYIEDKSIEMLSPLVKPAVLELEMVDPHYELVEPIPHVQENTTPSPTIAKPIITPTVSPLKTPVEKSISKPTKLKPVPVKRPKYMSKSLPECVRLSSGASRPGLLALPLNSQSKAGIPLARSILDSKSTNLTRLPQALIITPRTSPQKTVALAVPPEPIKKQIKNPSRSKFPVKTPKLKNGIERKDSLRYTNPNTGKEIELDLNRSLLEQLADIENEDDFF